MAIPDYVHPIRLMLACVGIDPRRPFPSPAIALQRISSNLEIPPTKAIEFVDSLRSNFAPLESQLTENPEILLRMESLIESFTSGLKEPLERLDRNIIQNVFDGFETWLLANLRVDSETFGQLFQFAFGRFQSTLYKPGTRPRVLDELDRFCDALIDAAPLAFRAAHQTFTADTMSRTSAGVLRQQAALHPLYDVMQAGRHEANGARYSALLDRLRAWADAAETTIYDVVKFVWTMGGYPNSLTEQLPHQDTPPREELFSLAAKWCDEHAVPFPFRRDLFSLSNAVAHKCITLSDSGVSFHDVDGRIIATWGFNETAEVIEHDIFLATHFASVLVWAEFRHQDRAGKFDDAWVTAKSSIPNLELLTVDIDAIWPTHARLARFQYQRVATFKPLAAPAPLSPPVPPSSVEVRGVISSICTSSEAEVQLGELLLELFSADELRRFVHLHYPKLKHELREGTTPREQFQSLVETMRRYGELDAALFFRLHDERPRRTAEIDAVGILFGIPGVGVMAPPASAPGAEPIADRPTPAASTGRTSPSGSPPTTSRRERFMRAINQLDPQGDPGLALKNGLHVEEPGQSFTDQTLSRLELFPKSSHILTGPSGTGKTTQLHILQQKLTGSGEHIPVYINATTVTGDLWRHDTLSTLLLNEARDLGMLEPANIQSNPFDMAFFQALVSSLPPLAIVKSVSGIKGLRKFVLMLDLPDQLPGERFAALCGGELAELMQFIPVIVVAPRSALSGPSRDCVNGFKFCSQQPTHDPAQGGTMRAFLMQVISQRADGLIPPDCCAQLVDASGGALSDLLALAQGALAESYVAGYNLVELDDVSRAINIFGRKHLAGLDSHDLSRIQHVRLTGTFMPKDDRDIHLLSTRRILEYADPASASRFSVHPTLLPLLPLPDPLDLL